MAIEEPIEALDPAPRGSIGIDLGVADLATLGSGETKLQQRLARQQKGSHRRGRTKHRIARLHWRIGDCRREHLHRVSTRIVRENQVTGVEDLNTEGMGRSARGTKATPGGRPGRRRG